MKKEKISRKGFTLIELLLVIVVVVILAGTIMVSGEESIISAEANNIINNMRILKSAALEWLADYGDFVDQTGEFNYMVTYPHSTLHDKYFLKGKAEQCIQNLMRKKDEKDHGRDTMMKYIKTENPISVNEDTGNGSGPIQGGYALVDSTRDLKESAFNKWYVVYRFETENTHVKKLKQKIADRKEEYRLLKDAKTLYTTDKSYVYMEIIDLAKNK